LQRRKAREKKMHPFHRFCNILAPPKMCNRRPCVVLATPPITEIISSTVSEFNAEITENIYSSVEEYTIF
jgi:hypothetical protein